MKANKKRPKDRQLPKPKSALDQLLDGVTEENIHKEVSTGKPVGREAWQAPEDCVPDERNR
jgi:hypothetical protein